MAGPTSTGREDNSCCALGHGNDSSIIMKQEIVLSARLNTMHKCPMVVCITEQTVDDDDDDDDSDDCALVL